MTPHARQADYVDKRRPKNHCPSVLCCRRAQTTPHNHPLSINGVIDLPVVRFATLVRGDPSAKC